MAKPHNRSRPEAAGHSTSRLALVAAAAFAIPIAVLVPMLPADTLAPPGAGQAADESGDATMQAELTRLRAERQRWLDGASDPGSRTEVKNVAAVDATAKLSASASEPVPLETREAVTALLAELQDQFETGVMRDRFLRNPTQLAQLVLTGWIESGHPSRALAVLRRLPPGMVESETLISIATQLQKANDKAGATEVYLRGLRTGEDDWRFAEQLADMDPEAGLAQLRLSNQEDPLGPRPDFPTQELGMLLACRRMDEAKALLTTLMAQEPITEDGSTGWMGMLIHRDPALAIQVLEQGAAKALPPVDAAVLEASARKAAGDSAAAKEALLKALQLNPTHGQAWYQLAELDTGAALQFLNSLSIPDPEGEFAVRRANLLTREGRTEEATGILLNLAETNWDAVSRTLLQTAPDLAVAKARTLNDDELLGDAADLAWQKDQRERATELWREAARIDPGDSEWRGKLRRVRLGLDPLESY
jgi:tetratricopeptide (TPR) repeat protein